MHWHQTMKHKSLCDECVPMNIRCLCYSFFLNYTQEYYLFVLIFKICFQWVIIEFICHYSIQLYILLGYPGNKALVGICWLCTDLVEFVLNGPVWALLSNQYRFYLVSVALNQSACLQEIAMSSVIIQPQYPQVLLLTSQKNVRQAHLLKSQVKASVMFLGLIDLISIHDSNHGGVIKGDKRTWDNAG